MNGLYTHGSSPRDQMQEWEKRALDKFLAKMSDKEKPFPCIPATIGFSKNQLRYGFVGDPRENSTLTELSSLLTSYTELSSKIGNYTSLIVFYETPESMNDNTVEEFEQLFWNHLNGLSSLDKFDWPEDIPTDPHDPIWEFCFHGEKYFMYCATPAHKNRKSRHFDVMMLAITPRWVLQEFNKSQSYARRIKAHVRERLSKYDSISIHPDLNTYGSEDNFEWRQYFLRDDDTSLSKCPYHRVLKFLGIDK
ncbi:YqcI/YcgG family protein [Mesobacillus boroniphilus]|uniref:YqcI/YcgG family protein n=1 Tax=Mesobacillus boroniphilus TaxID=308892 RepID=A0A944CJR4_9BACI|nr:YqcI/YcgG family protein [Mesobacillus boroniphilus]MBS8263747.1 YqcI/YcgG family protein [Mesobacillus boroniphilus]